MKRYHLWLLVAILAGLALRLHNLTYHSFWFDEAISAYWARQSAPRIIEVGLTLVEDRLPPLYYLALKGWGGLVGFSETGLRSLSVLAGLLLVPVVARLAAALFDRRVAVLAAWLVALNPFLVWYAQEARMYALAGLLGALAVWAFLEMVQSTRAGHPASLLPAGLFVLLATAGLYTHLYTGFLLPALGLWLVITHPRRPRLWLLPAASGLVVALLFAPLALTTWRFSGEATPGDPLGGLGPRAWNLLHAFTVWKAPLPAWLQVALPLTVLFLAAAAYLGRPGPAAARLPAPRLLVSLLLLFPFLIATLLLGRNYLAFFGERYFIVMTPWLLLLAALGAIKLAQWLREYLSPGRDLARALLPMLPPALLLLATAAPIPGLWSIAAAKEGWRQSVAYLAEQARPDHAILIHPDWVRYPFQFYFRGPGQTYAAFSNVGPDTDLDGPLQGVVDDHPVIWLIQSHLDGPDPGHRVEGWFAARYPLVTELYPPGISLKGFAAGYQLRSLPPDASPVDIGFESGLRLRGYRSDPTAVAADQLFHPPSGWLHVTLYWTADRPIEEELHPTVALAGPEGVWGVSLERTNDALHMYPTSRWPAPGGPIIRHDLDVNLNPITPPGRYQLFVALPGEAGQRLLGEVDVRPE